MAWVRKSRGSASHLRSPFNWFFWIAVAGFLALAGFGVQEILTERETARWPEAPCRIPTQHGASREEKTQRSVFLTLPLTPAGQFETSAFGQARGMLPAMVMHSFEGLKTKILWQIRADFAQPAGLSREYQVVVRPPPPKV